ncbi:MAG: endonuclease/exonuclease/phosphatase family protein [Candidatus Moraniibacteriota bacterium]
MRLICLNTWGGNAGIEDLLAFFRHHQKIDIFCLQEIHTDGAESVGLRVTPDQTLDNIEPELLRRIEEVLPEHQTLFMPLWKAQYGQVIFVKKGIEVLETAEWAVYRERGYLSPHVIADHARLIQCVWLNTKEGPVAVLNLHGLWNGQGKEDSEDRLEQSRRTLAFIEQLDVPFILAGDLNLGLETESLKMLEAAGLRNLVREYGIPSTRTRFYKKSDPFADYVLTSAGIRVEDFQALPDEVSDHAALCLDFSLE